MKKELDEGSPPHTWRIHDFLRVFPSDLGITSTYVENTMNNLNVLEMNKDHLHIRGEYSKFESCSALLSGSPPHTWRIQKIAQEIIYGNGITSTYVENTVVAQRSMARTRDHLHIRGEYSKQIPL